MAADRNAAKLSLFGAAGMAIGGIVGAVLALRSVHVAGFRGRKAD